MPQTFKTTRRVEFADTDAAGIMHFAAFFRFMEEAEHELLRTVSLSVMMHDDGGPISWPRVGARCEFQSAARFEDVLEIEVAIRRLGEKSVSYAFAFECEGRDIALGEMTSVCCRLSSDAAPQSIAIPAWFRDKLAGYVSGQ